MEWKNDVLKTNEWEIVDLEKHIWFQEGPGVRNHQYTNQGVKLLNVANLKDGKIDLSASHRYISQEEASGKYSHFLVDEGDLIIASSGIKVEYFEKKMGFAKKEHLPLCMNTSTIRFKSLDEEKMDIAYFSYFLKSVHFKSQIAKLITGSAQLNFGPTHLRSIKVPLPPLQTQQKIVQVMDKAQSLIDKRKEQIELMDELIQSTFYEMFGDPVVNEKSWEIRLLRDSVSIVGGYAFKSDQFRSSGIPVIKIGTVNKGYFNMETLSYLEEELLEKFSKYVVYPGDLLISLTGTVGKEDYGNTCIANDTYKSYFLNQRVAKLIVKKTCNIIFLHHLLKDPKVRRKLTGVSRGVRQANISNDDIYSLNIILPPIELQNQFDEIVQKIEAQKQLMEQSLTKMENNYNSLMQRAFSAKGFN